MSIMQALSQAQHSQISALQPGQGPRHDSSQSPIEDARAGAGLSASVVSENAANIESSAAAGGVDMTSLRARALLSMKSKRRKATDGGAQPVVHKPLASLPPSRPIEDSVMLDYGSEEQTSSSTLQIGSVDREVEKSSVTETRREGLGREDGEVSDEEPDHVTTEKEDAIVDMEVENQEEEVRAGEPSDTVLPATVVGTQKPVQEVKVSELLFANETSTIFQAPSWVPDPNHVRPGLTMTLQQLNTAKEIVLDLLGWGVAPEFLVDCGVSREAVFYTFTELNLRLPANLNTTGLFPFPPPIPTFVAPTPSLKKDTAVPEGSTTLSPVPRFSAAPSSPSRDGPSSSTLQPVSPSSTDSVQAQTLADMEAQKRQQLMARKAALASRKKKAIQSDSPASQPVTTKEPNAIAIASSSKVDVQSAQHEAAEDFLQSMLASSSVLPPPVTPSIPSTLPESATLIETSFTSPTSPISTTSASVHHRRKSSGGIISGGVALGVSPQRSPKTVILTPILIEPESLTIEDTHITKQEIKETSKESNAPILPATPASATSASSPMSVSPVASRSLVSHLPTSALESVPLPTTVAPTSAEEQEPVVDVDESKNLSKEDKRDIMDIDFEENGIPGFGNYNRLPQVVSVMPTPKDTHLVITTSLAKPIASSLDPSAAPFEPASASAMTQTPSSSLSTTLISASEQSLGSTRPRTPGSNSSTDKFESNVTPIQTSHPDTSTLPISASKSALAASNESQVLPPKLQANGRRGLKRPVAMDFVDIEPASESESLRTVQRTSSRHSTTIGNPAPPPHVRRKIHGPGQYGTFGGSSSSGSFAGLGHHHARRCVIDLSDSEDEPEEPGGEGGGGDGRGGGERAGSVPRRPASVAPPRSDTMTPASLAAKEAQIKAMKELIAKRERERLQKLELPSGFEGLLLTKGPDLVQKQRTPTATPPPNASMTQSSTVDTPVDEREDEDTKACRTPVETENVEPPQDRSQTHSSSDSQADEDVVMQNLIDDTTANSALPTAIEGVEIDSEYTVTDEPALKAEDEGEQAVSHPQDPKTGEASEEPMDAAANAPSAEANDVEEQHPPLFHTYDSPFYSYPLLRSRSRVVSDLKTITYLTSSSPGNSLPAENVKIPVPDLRPLRIAVLLREAGGDPEKRLCQFEIPGGGICRDKTCNDLHVNDLQPDDLETARYLHETMPDALKAFDESEIADQLLQARQKRGKVLGTSPTAIPTSLEELVTEAVVALIGTS